MGGQVWAMAGLGLQGHLYWIGQGHHLGTHRAQSTEQKGLRT